MLSFVQGEDGGWLVFSRLATVKAWLGKPFLEAVLI